jgi:hypothetical protein
MRPWQPPSPLLFSVAPSCASEERKISDHLTQVRDDGLAGLEASAVPSLLFEC